MSKKTELYSIFKAIQSANNRYKTYPTNYADKYNNNMYKKHQGYKYKLQEGGAPTMQQFFEYGYPTPGLPYIFGEGGSATEEIINMGQQMGELPMMQMGQSFADNQMEDAARYGYMAKGGSIQTVDSKFPNEKLGKFIGTIKNKAETFVKNKITKELNDAYMQTQLNPPMYNSIPMADWGGGFKQTAGNMPDQNVDYNQIAQINALYNQPLPDLEDSFSNFITDLGTDQYVKRITYKDLENPYWKSSEGDPNYSELPNYLPETQKVTANPIYINKEAYGGVPTFAPGGGLFRRKKIKYNTKENDLTGPTDVFSDDAAYQAFLKNNDFKRVIEEYMERRQMDPKVFADKAGMSADQLKEWLANPEMLSDDDKNLILVNLENTFSRFKRPESLRVKTRDEIIAANRAAANAERAAAGLPPYTWLDPSTRNAQVQQAIEDQKTEDNPPVNNTSSNVQPISGGVNQMISSAGNNSNLSTAGNIPVVNNSSGNTTGNNSTVANNAQVVGANPSGNGQGNLSSSGTTTGVTNGQGNGNLAGASPSNAAQAGDNTPVTANSNNPTTNNTATNNTGSVLTGPARISAVEADYRWNPFSFVRGKDANGKRIQKRPGQVKHHRIEFGYGPPIPAQVGVDGAKVAGNTDNKSGAGKTDIKTQNNQQIPNNNPGSSTGNNATVTGTGTNNAGSTNAGSTNAGNYQQALQNAIANSGLSVDAWAAAHGFTYPEQIQGILNGTVTLKPEEIDFFNAAITQPPSQRWGGGLRRFVDGGFTDPPKKTTYTPPMPSIIEPAVSTNVFVPNPQFGNLSLNTMNEAIPAQPVNEYFPTDAYIAELRNQENAGKTGFKNNKFYSYPSVEGGTPTIAYGHKLTKDEVNKGTYNGGLTEDQATKLMMEDLAKNVTRARDSFDTKYGQGRFDSLPTELKDLVVDYSYTGTGVNKFPSFHGAINDYILAKTPQEKAKAQQRMKAEYKRHTGGKELTSRNKFSEKIINSLDVQQYGGNKFDNGGSNPIGIDPTKFNQAVYDELAAKAGPAPENMVNPYLVTTSADYDYGFNPADSIMHGMGFITNLKNRMDYAKNSFPNKLSASNIFKEQDNNNRGDYAVNSGMLGIGNTTTGMRMSKYGGDENSEGNIYFLDEDTIRQILAMGGTVEYLD